MSELAPILSDTSTSISELKKNPMGVMEQANGAPVAVLNRNRPVFYCLSAETYEALLDHIEDLELAAIVKERQSEEEVVVSLDEL
ncbi:antitoxin StbD [Halospina denitrificans]|uniref:Antitoxin n=1 Tax=Halospina denitrificans TaxID=332522 RepID=A0A4R7JSF8_9GAMM|nr:type II toxin-antitoxin system Phd/YefM family antitoxin [Halospina denitrificans]TDT40213.1 antitoxin StbD [Halospina denitrificans]